MLHSTTIHTSLLLFLCVMYCTCSLLFTVWMAFYSMFRCRYRTGEAISVLQRMDWVTQRSKSLF